MGVVPGAGVRVPLDGAAAIFDAAPRTSDAAVCFPPVDRDAPVALRPAAGRADPGIACVCAGAVRAPPFFKRIAA
jgi:hypothetical protein